MELVVVEKATVAVAVVIEKATVALKEMEMEFG